MLIWASWQERCKIRPQRGFCVLGEGGRAGGALSIHLPPFPSFFLCLGGAESRRRGGCEDPGALHSFQRGAATGLGRPCGQCRTPVQGLGGSGGSVGGCTGSAQPTKVMEQAAPRTLAWLAAGGTWQPGSGHLGLAGGIFGIIALELSPPHSAPGQSWHGDTRGAAWRGARGGWGDVVPPKPGYPNPRGMLGARAGSDI